MDNNGNVTYGNISGHGKYAETSFEYDDDDRLIETRNSELRSIDYIYDEEGKLTEREQSTNTPTTEQFTCNGDGNVSTHSTGSDVYSYTYNDYGQITEIRKNNTVRQRFHTVVKK